MSGELTQFEQQSSLTPKKTPYAIIGGFVLFLIMAFIINNFATNAGVSEMKENAAKAKEKEAAAATAAPAADDGAAPADDL